MLTATFDPIKKFWNEAIPAAVSPHLMMTGGGPARASPARQCPGSRTGSVSHLPNSSGSRRFHVNCFNSPTGSIAIFIKQVDRVGWSADRRYDCPIKQ